MKILTLDDEYIKWSPVGMGTKDHRAKSSLHQKARELIYEKYGRTCAILEEVSIPVRRRQTLYLDFYIPLLKKAFEVHGEQHFKFTPHFHGTAAGFMEHKKRDADKENWCDINGIELVALNYNEDWAV